MPNDDKKQQNWIKNFGKNLIKSVEIKIGNTVIDKIYNNYIDDYDKFSIYDKIGFQKEAIREDIYHIPLNFYFDKNNNIISSLGFKKNIFAQNPQDIFIEL